MEKLQVQDRVADELPHSRFPNKEAARVVTLSDILWSRPGSARRSKLLNYLRKEDRGIPINRKWQLRDTDPDIKQLLKKGLAVRKRVHATRSSGQTYLRATTLVA
ncbi:hypothetical protein LMG26857_03519 [Achromobacter anxifer]|uniref:hypothetical protein n=1 Tax=Achromobacter anxifer TaxID=1287737 RepID=UPI00155D283E|nr:hypothetical protein [Achromobacter anxifer]CAB5514460.1 hypothetical protein LMG26857_03519 [Achromobacter anxifer]